MFIISDIKFKSIKIFLGGVNNVNNYLFSSMIYSMVFIIIYHFDFVSGFAVS